MLSGPFIEHIWELVLLLTILFIMTKFIAIRVIGIERLSSNIFFVSLRNPDKYMMAKVRKPTKWYLKFINVINALFLHYNYRRIFHVRVFSIYRELNSLL